MRIMIMAAAVAALAFASTAEAKPAAAAKPAASKAAPCKDAKGHFIKCPAPSATPMAPTPAAAMKSGKSKMAAGPKAAPKCKTGVPCGNSCIPKGKVCHK